MNKFLVSTVTFLGLTTALCTSTIAEETQLQLAQLTLTEEQIQEMQMQIESQTLIEEQNQGDVYQMPAEQAQFIKMLEELGIAPRANGDGFPPNQVVVYQSGEPSAVTVALCLASGGEYGGVTTVVPMASKTTVVPMASKSAIQKSAIQTRPNEIAVDVRPVEEYQLQPYYVMCNF